MASQEVLVCIRPQESTDRCSKHVMSLGPRPRPMSHVMLVPRLFRPGKLIPLRKDTRKSIPGKLFHRKSIDTGSMHSALRPFPLGQGGWALYGNFVRDQHEKVLPLSAGKGDCQSEETTTVATWPHRRSSRAIRPRLLLQSLHTVRIMVRDGAGVRARVRVGAGVGVGPDKCAPPRLRAARAGGTRVPPPSAPRLNGVRVGVRVWG